MGEAWEAQRLSKLHFEWPPSLLNSFGIQPNNAGQPNTVVSNVNLIDNMVMTNGTFPVDSALKAPHSVVGLLSEPPNMLQFKAPSRQVCLSAKNPTPAGNIPALSKGFLKEAVAPLTRSGLQQKGFLVIDQSADKTTLVLCSGGGAPLQLLTSWSPQPTAAFKSGQDIENKGDLVYDSKLVSSTGFPENHQTDEQSEMQEDSEELNALLYSDDESDIDGDDEVTSTGHSPSIMTTKDKQYVFDKENEEVASSAGSTRKRKIDEGYDATSLIDTASSLKPERSPDLDDDAQSSCANEETGVMDDMSSSSVNKKMKKDKIRETVGILRGIIPGGENKEAILVLDEAIQYLKSLKLKAVALGLNAC